MRRHWWRRVRCAVRSWLAFAGGERRRQQNQLPNCIGAAASKAQLRAAGNCEIPEARELAGALREIHVIHPSIVERIGVRRMLLRCQNIVLVARLLAQHDRGVRHDPVDQPPMNRRTEPRRLEDEQRQQTAAL